MDQTKCGNSTLGYNIVYIKKSSISKCLYSTLRAKGKVMAHIPSR
jgi:hypothetical protein